MTDAYTQDREDALGLRFGGMPTVSRGVHRTPTAAGEHGRGK